MCTQNQLNRYLGQSQIILKKNITKQPIWIALVDLHATLTLDEFQIDFNATYPSSLSTKSNSLVSFN